MSAVPPGIHVAYTLEVEKPGQPLYRVRVRAEGVSGPKVSFQLPGWTPGWYVFRGNERHLSGFSAQGPGAQVLPVRQTEARTWEVETQGATSITFSYALRASDTAFGFFEPYLDAHHGFVPGPAALTYVVGAKDAPCSITYAVPPGWQVASANTAVADQPSTFTAPDYDTLIDQPAELGEFLRVDRTIRGVPLSVILVGAEKLPTARWVEGVFKIAEAGIALLGGAPFPRYVFFFHFAATEGFTGGLEHLNGTVIRLHPRALREADAENLTLVAHEFLHAWNVKRARPAALGPFDYTRPVRVKDLWFCEGVTDYFAPRLLVEAGLARRSFWLGYQGEQLTQLMSNPARHLVTLEEASRKVWESEVESEGFGGLSYYNKGLVVGLLLDIELRQRTANRVGLLELLRALVAQCQKRGVGYAEGEIEQLASSLSGTDFGPFFARALRSTEELPIRETLAAGGIEAETAVARSPFLGIAWDQKGSVPGQLRISGLVEKGPALKAGLRVGDVITRFDGRPVEELQGAVLGQRQPGETLRVTFVRGGVAQQCDLVLGVDEAWSYRLKPLSRPTAQQAGILAKISGTP